MKIGNTLKVTKNAVTSKAGLSLLKVSKRSPSLLFGAGVIGFGATVFLASKATLKLGDVLDEHEFKQGEASDMHQVDRLTDVVKADKDYKKDTAVLKVRLAKDVTRLYAPAVIVGVVSVGCLTGSHVVLNRRYAGVVAAYSTLDKSFKEYRGRVTEAYGAEVDKKLLHGVETREIVSDDGSKVSTVEGAAGHSPYAKLFADHTTAEWSPQADYNLFYIRAQQQYANDTLNLKGYVFLNDIYKALGFEPTAAGQVVGWVKNNPKPEGGDNYVDFGIFDQPDRFADFMRGSEGGIWLDFNVDGVVYDLLGK